MNFSGTIDESSGMTMTRLIERIVHTDTPGELRLHDEGTGRRATVAIRRGMVQDVAFGELSGDPALTAISQAMPWTFEFVSDEAGAVPSHPGIVPRKPRARAVIRPAVVAGTEGWGDGGMEGMRDSGVMPAPSIPPSLVPSVSPSLSESHRDWINAPASAHCIHFGTAGGEFAGEVHEDDHDYFRSDFSFLRSTAEGIARSLGWPAPTVFAIAEAERATGYAVLNGGFLGAIGGAGTGVSHVTDFPGMNVDLEHLASLDGVTGLCHHRGGIIQWQRLPDSLSRDSAAALCANVSKAFAAYHSAGRPLTAAYLESPPHCILVTARTPAAGDEPPREFLTFLLAGRAVAGAVSAAAAAWQTTGS